MLTCQRTSGVTTRIPKKLLGDEGPSSGETKMNLTFIIAELRGPEHNIGSESKRRDKVQIEEKRSKTPEDVSSDFEHEEGLEDAYEDLNSPYKRPKPTLFTHRITRFKYHRRSKLLRNIRVYEGNKDPEDHLAFMHGHGHPELAKKLNDKIPKTVDKMFERVKAFIRGEVAAGSAEMVRPSQGDKGYVRLAWSGVPEKSRNRGDPREARRNMGVYTSYPRKDTFTPLIKTLKEILAMESVSFPEPLPLIGTLEKEHVNKFCDYHGDRGHKPNDCYQLKKQIEEAATSRKLAHLVRTSAGIINGIRTKDGTVLSQLTNEPIILEGIIEGNQVRRILVDGGSSSEIMYEHSFRNLDINIRSRLRRIREQVILRARSNSRRRPSSGPVSLEKIRSKEDIEEVFTISHERPDQYVTMGATLTTNCKQLLTEDDGKGLSRSKRTKRGNTLGGRSNKKQKVKEGKFLSHMVTEEGLRADPEKIQAIILSPTPRRIVLVIPEEKRHSYAIRLKFNASNHVMDCEALLAGLVASTNQGLETIKLEFLNQEVSVGIKTRPSVEEARSSKKGKAAINAPKAEPNYNHEASGSN
ncbi:hypothetical protein Tco_0779657 [Tanacetum coccineum]